MMHDSFFFSSTIENFLFGGVSIETKLGMVSLCLGMASLSMLIEGLKACRYHFLQPKDLLTRIPATESIVIHALGATLFVITFFFNYLMMLSVMTFNAYFLIAAVSGSGLGYLCFGFLSLPEFTNPRIISRQEDSGNSRNLDYGATGHSVNCGLVVGPEGDTRSSYGTCGFVGSPSVSSQSGIKNSILSVGNSIENVGDVNCCPENEYLVDISGGESVGETIEGQLLIENASQPSYNIVKVEVDVHPTGSDIL